MGDLGCNKSKCLISKKRQLLTTLSATLGSFGLGTVLGWTSPALPDLKERGNLGELSASEVTWIASIAIVGCIVSGPVAGLLVNKLGRKMTMSVLSLPFALGWLLIAGSIKFTPMIYFGRFITGFCGGTFTVVVPIYVSEIAEESFRGLLGSLMVLMLVSGILFTFVFGAILSWFWLSFTCGLFPLLAFIALLFVPESPKYLLDKKRYFEAEKAFRWLRNLRNDEKIDDKFFMPSIKPSPEKVKPISSNWRKPHVIKPASICLCLMFFQQLGGINSVTMYTVDIFKSTSDVIDPNFACIIIGIVQVIFVGLSMLLVDRLGRRVILITSSVLMSGSLALLGYFFYIKEENNGVVPPAIAWVPIVTLVTFIIAYSFGMGPIPWLLVSELLSPYFKGEITALITFTYWSLAFLATKTFQDTIDLLNESGCYWTYSIICLGGAVFGLIVIPETNKKTSVEIQRYFGDKFAIEIVDDDNSSQSEDLLSKDDNRNFRNDLKAPVRRLSFTA